MKTLEELAWGVVHLETLEAPDREAIATALEQLAAHTAGKKFLNLDGAAEQTEAIQARHAERQRKIDNAARDAAAGSRLAALCHGRDQMHDDRGALLEINQALRDKLGSHEMELLRADKDIAALTERCRVAEALNTAQRKRLDKITETVQK